jgi:hypothetical protein
MSDYLEFRFLKYILTFAETLNFTRAAQRLFLAQPFVTHASIWSNLSANMGLFPKNLTSKPRYGIESIALITPTLPSKTRMVPTCDFEKWQHSLAYLS